MEQLSTVKFIASEGSLPRDAFTENAFAKAVKSDWRGSMSIGS